MSDSTANIDQVSQTAIQRETTINGNIDALSPSSIFGRRASTCAALVFGYYGGRLNGTSVANGTVTATNAATNYVVADKSTLAVSISTSITNWNNTTTYARMYLLTAAGSVITAYEDHRAGTNGVLGGGTSGSSTAGVTINAQVGTTYTVLVGDLAKLVTHSNAASIAVTLPQATGSFTTPFYYDTKNVGVGAVTITPTTSTIDGAATLVLTTGQSVRIVSDGTNYIVYELPPGQTINAQVGTTYTVLSSDRGKCVTLSNAASIAVTLPQATTAFGAKFLVDFRNLGVGAVTITPTTSTINGAATLVLNTGQSVRVISDGTNYQTEFQSRRPSVNAQTGTTYTYLAGDDGKLVTHTNAAAIAGTLPQATTAFGAGWFMYVQNRGVGTLTITPTTSTIDGAATLALATSQGAIIFSDGTNYFTNRGIATTSAQTKVIQVACSDQTTAITTGTAKVTFRMPYAMTVTDVRASVNTVSSSGTPTIDINEAGTTILSTKLTIDATEFTSTTAAVPAVISDSSLADDAEITIDFDVAGTGAKGVVVSIIGT